MRTGRYLIWLSLLLVFAAAIIFASFIIAPSRGNYHATCYTQDGAVIFDQTVDSAAVSDGTWRFQTDDKVVHVTGTCVVE